MNIEIDPLSGKIIVSGITLELIGFVSAQDFNSFQSANQLVLTQLAGRIAALENRQPSPSPSPTPSSTTQIAVINHEYILKGGARLIYRGNSVGMYHSNGNVYYVGNTDTTEIKVNLELGIAENVDNTFFKFVPVNNGYWGNSAWTNLAEYQAF